MYIKICANTNLEDALAATELGADAVGFIFAPSKRRVTAEQVAAITRLLPASVAKIGVFTQPDTDSISETVRVAGLTGVQLHMPPAEAPVAAMHSRFGDALDIWQVLSVETEGVSGSDPYRQLAMDLEAAMTDPRLTAVLLDTAKAGVSGGLGESFSWSRVRPLLREVRGRLAGADASVAPRRLITAGGLTPDNVRTALELLEPDGVDVASGVEVTPGRKSTEKLAAFLQAARQPSASRQS